MMEHLFMLFLIFSLISIVDCFYQNTSLYEPEYYEFINDQTRLLQDIFTDYDATAAPIYTKRSRNGSLDEPRKFNYTLNLYYIKLIEVDEPQEKVTVVMEIMEVWYDIRLAWDPKNYSGQEFVYVRQEKVWSPTFSVFGVNELLDFRDPDFRQVAIGYPGRVHDQMSLRVAIPCKLNVYKFPFDTQTCQFRFALPLFDWKEIEMFNDAYTGFLTEELSDGMGNSEWKILNLTYRIETLGYTNNLAQLDLSIFEIKMRRNPMYYMYMIVFPAYVINFVSIIGIFLKGADKMSRLNVGLTNIMTMTFILGVMADKIPKTGTIPMLGVYIIANLSIMIIAIASAVGVSELRKWAVPRLKLKKTWLSRKLERFLGSPVEYTVAAFLLIATSTNFFIMIGFWIGDS